MTRLPKPMKKPLPRVTITSDGTPQGTQVLNADGKPIPGIRKVSWSLEVGELAEVHLVLTGHVDASAALKGVRVHSPELKALRRAHRGTLLRVTARAILRKLIRKV